MHWSSLVFWAIVLCVGFPSALKNWTALALVWSWLIGVAWTWKTGEVLPLRGDILRDMMVLVVVFAKVSDDCEPSPGLLGWVRDCWPQASTWDKAVVCLFLPMWVTYAFVIEPWAAYWILVIAGIAQFACVGVEATEDWRRGRAQTEAVNPTDPSLSRQGLRHYEC